MNSSVQKTNFAFLQQSLDFPDHLEPQTLVLTNGVRLEFLQTGVLRVSPNKTKARYRVLISCGIHGNETAPIEIVDQLVNEIVSGALVVKNELLFILGNPPAAKLEERFVEENLNRLFSNKHSESSSVEAKRALCIEQFTADFFDQGDQPRLHYDLHTAIRGSEYEKFAVTPFLHEREYSPAQFAFLEDCGIQAMLLSNQPSGTYSYYTSNAFNAQSFTVELGKVEKFGENDMRKFSAVTDGLRRLIVDQQEFNQQPDQLEVFKVVEEIIKQTESFQLHIGANAKNFTQSPAGSLLASDKAYQYRTKQDGERFVFPITNVPCGQRAMLVVVPVNN